MAGGGHRLPIFQDDLTFQDRHTKSFQDMKDRMMNDSLGRGGFDTGFSRWNWEDEMDKICGDFFHLKPKGLGRRDDLKPGKEFGSRDSLDEHNTYVENPQTKSRTFHLSFDVKEYSPNEISVKAEGENLIVAARHVKQVGEHQNVKEFSRSIKIPKDVDIDKLSSTLSNDGILTIQAPVPPKYTSVAYINPLSGGQSQNGSNGGPPYRARGPAPPAHSQQSQYKAPPAPAHSQQSVQSQYSAPPSSVHSQSSIQSPQPQSPLYSQYPAPPPPVHAQYVQQQPQNARPSPPPPPPQQQPTQSPPSAMHQSSWPPPPPPQQQYEPSPLVSRSPPPLFDETPPPTMPLDTPYFENGQNGGPRQMELAIEVPKPFTPDDVVVKLEGKSLMVEAIHEEKAHGKTSKSSMSRSFDLEEDLDPASVEAMLRSDGCLLIKGFTIQKALT